MNRLKTDNIKRFSMLRLQDTARSFRKLGEVYDELSYRQEQALAAKRQLFAIADMLEDFCSQEVRTVPLARSHRGDIIRGLAARGIRIKYLEVYENPPGRHTLVIMAKQARGSCTAVKEAASVISRYFEGDFISAESNRNIIGNEYHIYRFLQAPRYKLFVQGVQMPKAGNQVSGDSYSISSLECARTVISLIDGMGSGARAHVESGQAVELMEHFLEAGFDEESAIAMINGAFSANAAREKTLAVDIGVIDCYLGFFSCLKMGAVSTYIKRDGWIEVIKSTTLPIGILPQVDCDSTVKKLYDGDFVIMISDGILENLPAQDKELALLDIIDGISTRNAGELAQRILDEVLAAGGGLAKDDMTVLAAGMFDTNIKVY